MWVDTDRKTIIEGVILKSEYFYNTAVVADICEVYDIYRVGVGTQYVLHDNINRAHKWGTDIETLKRDLLFGGVGVL